jgi:hypothetical protein
MENSAGKQRRRGGVAGDVAVEPVVVAERILARERRVRGDLLRPSGR